MHASSCCSSACRLAALVEQDSELNRALQAGGRPRPSSSRGHVSYQLWPFGGRPSPGQGYKIRDGTKNKQTKNTRSLTSAVIFPGFLPLLQPISKAMSALDPRKPRTWRGVRALCLNTVAWGTHGFRLFTRLLGLSCCCGNAPGGPGSRRRGAGHGKALLPPSGAGEAAPPRNDRAAGRDAPCGELRLRLQRRQLKSTPPVPKRSH